MMALQRSPGDKEFAMLTYAAVLLLAFTWSERIMAQESGEHLIEQLKKTPVNQIEAGLPKESFDSWFTGLAKPAQVEYAFEECTPQSSTAVIAFCVVAYTKPAQPDWPRRIQLQFVVTGPTARKTGNPRPAGKDFNCKFIGGVENPESPMMKRPSRKIATLSELEKLLRGSRTP
jgi:hypothetical protein